MGTKSATFTLNANQTQSPVTSRATVTGTTVYGHSISAYEDITQSGAVGEYFYWVPRPGVYTTAATSSVISASGTTSMNYETNISNINWMYVMNSNFVVDTSTPGVVTVHFTENTGDTRTYAIMARKGMTTLGTWTITQSGGAEPPAPATCTITLEYIDFEVLATIQYGTLQAAAWIQTGSTAPQNWPSSNILSGSTPNDGTGHHITKTGNVSITVPKNTTIYIFADGKGATEPYYEKTSVNSAYAQLNIASEPMSTVAMSPSSPGNYYMVGSFLATKDTVISVYGDFTARGF